MSSFQSVLGNSRTSSNPVPAILIIATSTYHPRQENCYSTPTASSLPPFPAPSIRDPNPSHQTQPHVLDLRSSDPTKRDDEHLDERSDKVSAVTTLIPAVEFILSPDLTAASPGEAQKWHLTTYWSCVTDYDITTTTHCGWHEPVLPGGDEISGAPRTGFEAVGRSVRVALAAAAGGLLLEMALF